MTNSSHHIMGIWWQVSGVKQCTPVSHLRLAWKELRDASYLLIPMHYSYRLLQRCVGRLVWRVTPSSCKSSCKTRRRRWKEAGVLCCFFHRFLILAQNHSPDKWSTGESRGVVLTQMRAQILCWKTLNYWWATSSPWVSFIIACDL